MGIVFFCRSCGARFEVDPRMAGKKGRCRKCGHRTTIPRPEELSVLTAPPVPPEMLSSGAGAAGIATASRASAGRVRQATVDEAPSLAAWLRAGISQVGLAPLTELEKRPAAPYLPPALDDGDDDAQPYALAAPMKLDRGRVRANDFAAVRLWRREVGAVQKVFRWLNESAYFASVPFLVVLLFGTAVKSRPLALLGATVVVLLNIGRAAAGAVNLVLVPLRDGLDLARMKKPARRVAEPILTIALVVAAFSFIPWLSPGNTDGGGVAHRLRAGASALEKDIRREVDSAVDKARDIDLDSIGKSARQRIEGLTGEERRKD